MAYNTIEPDVRRIIRKTRGTSGLREALAEFHYEQGERLEREAAHCEGSEQKGRLEEALVEYEISFREYPHLKTAQKLVSGYVKLGTIKKDHGMPGVEEDFAKSEFYQEQIQHQRTHRCPERNHLR